MKAHAPAPRARSVSPQPHGLPVSHRLGSFHSPAQRRPRVSIHAESPKHVRFAEAKTMTFLPTFAGNCSPACPREAVEEICHFRDQAVEQRLTEAFERRLTESVGRLRREIAEAEDRTLWQLDQKIQEMGRLQKEASALALELRGFHTEAMGQQLCQIRDEIAASEERAVRHITPVRDECRAALAKMRGDLDAVRPEAIEEIRSCLELEREQRRFLIDSFRTGTEAKRRVECGAGEGKSSESLSAKLESLITNGGKRCECLDAEEKAWESLGGKKEESFSAKKLARAAPNHENIAAELRDALQAAVDAGDAAAAAVPLARLGDIVDGDWLPWEALMRLKVGKPVGEAMKTPPAGDQEVKMAASRLLRKFREMAARNHVEAGSNHY